MLQAPILWPFKREVNDVDTSPSCTVAVDQITFHGFDPDADPRFTIKVLQTKLAELEKKTTVTSDTDRHLTEYAKQAQFVRGAITIITINKLDAPGPRLSDQPNPKRDKRISKRMRRKAARADLHRQ